jgi:ribosome-binding factor A
VYISRVELSADTGFCYVYLVPFSSSSPEDIAETKISEKKVRAAIERLKLYRPSMRKALAGRVQTRYVPDIRFLFDDKEETVRNVNDALNKVQEELEESAQKPPSK